jgi:hypothetical protein
MAHPFNEHRAHKVERNRVATLTKGYAAGGAVQGFAKGGSVQAGGPATTKAVGMRDAQAVGGMPAKQRMDRPSPTSRARGGRTKGKGATHVNVIVGHGGGGPQLPGPMMPPRPPVMGPPPVAPAGGPPVMPPGAAPPGVGGLPMGPRRYGGRVGYAKGGSIKSGPAWSGGLASGTPVQHTPNKWDGSNIGRDKPITYSHGGTVKAAHGGIVYTSGDNEGANQKAMKTAGSTIVKHNMHHRENRMSGHVDGPFEAPPVGKGMAPKFHGGSHSGIGRLQKQSRARKSYAGPEPGSPTTDNMG